ncbi:MAG TPA: bifunctional hydroxymethylpyrimidine kinase/phosphomethylpyrimidine kinase, partial [Candidatus Coprenecus merdipullorum]|nr:bifunctional hydroxymethylpyrimidine kinase/phosphomethylpyrimidine kinase [Candidatus Coprenecus merdipullorum]
MENKKDFAKVFMIAGSEPLGCCGIQADIKAVSACGGFAAGATTLLVDMNTTKVKGIRTMPVDIILSQSRDFLDDVGADCIKTGMLYEKQIVEAVAGLLREYPEVPKVIDPVMVDSGGTALILQEAIDAYRELLFPQA